MRASIKGDDASISAEALQTLAVTSSQSTPMWKGLWVMLKYRTTVRASTSSFACPFHCDVDNALHPLCNSLQTGDFAHAV